MVRRWVLLPALALGAVWWWAVMRLALVPEQAGLVEGAVAAGGWGLSLLPVHVASRSGDADRAGGTTTATTASRRPRSAGGSGPS
ncbi:hypothetical protein [Streptomyces wuyuanensis]|jgi:hypothetical protein|uniref:hypothetical protein n=1 Tax=Streptomyces wuyuanensis TaxID=1196353 RepID=UPI00379F090F